MAMDTRMVLDFVQNRGPLGLSQIGQLAGQGIQGRRANKQRETLEAAYNQALDLVLQDPSEVNVARLYQVAQPLGRFDDARTAVTDYFERQQLAAENELTATGAAVEDIPTEHPNMRVYMNDLEAWMGNKLNSELQNKLLISSQAEGVDKYTEAQELVSNANQNRDTAEDEAAADASLVEYDRTGSSDDRLNVLSAFSRLGSEYAGVAMQALDSIEANWSEADKARILRDQTDALFEAQEQAGGNVRSERRDGYLCEWGPNGFLDNEPATLRLVEILGLQDQLVPASPLSEKRWIVRNGKPRQLPTHPLRFLFGDMLSLRGRVRAGHGGPQRHRQAGPDPAAATAGQLRHPSVLAPPRHPLESPPQQQPR